MGRRSTRTTKAGKFMNPTDQYRKEQRKKELKKNKKQRQIVREAVLRMKDVGQMLKEIEDIEEQELKSFGQIQYNERGLEEKKSKLHASIHRVARYYQQEDPKKAQELKLMIMESEQRRREMSRTYNAYTAARSKYSIEDIPMPDSLEGTLSDIPMPAAPGLSEEQSVSAPSLFPTPPPPPPGPPPSDLVEYNVIETCPPTAPLAKSVRFADEDKPVAQDNPETISSEEESEGEESEESDMEKDIDEEANTDDKNLKPPPQPPPPPAAGLTPAPPQIPPPAPPGPPPLLAQTFPPRFGMPPGPPPGPPPRFGSMPRPLMGAQLHSMAVVSAPPKSVKAGDPKSASAVISAQPQLRNMTAEVTKFMPTSLRVRRDQPKASKPKVKLGQEPVQQVSGRVVGSGGVQVQGDAYDTFMQEMQGLL